MPQLALAQTSSDQALQPAARPALPEKWRGTLNTLRIIALECRAEARTDLYEACRLISAENSDSHAAVLIRGLRSALERQPVFYRPGVQDVSFDESWLISALSACEAQDWHSLDFLIRSRVRTAHRRNIRFLLHGIVRHILNF
jgi:hypothetical protein